LDLAPQPPRLVTLSDVQCSSREVCRQGNCLVAKSGIDKCVKLPASHRHRVPTEPCQVKPVRQVAVQLCGFLRRSRASRVRLPENGRDIACPQRTNEDPFRLFLAIGKRHWNPGQR
jgi:hypothetical protein